jgi:hypothetical protein
MPIITSQIIRELPQADGRSYITERHVDHNGKSYDVEYLADAGLDTALVMQLRADKIGAEIDAREAAEAQALNFVLPVSKVAWRRRFTAAEQDIIDAFNEGGYLTHPALDEATKGAIRRGLVLYAATTDINPLDPDTQALLGLYTALGLLAPGRAAEIGAA